MRDDIPRTGEADPAPAEARLGWLRLAGVATHVMRLSPSPEPDAEEAALDLLCDAALGPVFRAGPGVFAFRPDGDAHALTDDVSEAAGVGVTLEEIAVPAQPETPEDRRRLAFVAPTAETLRGPALVLDAGLALETAAAAAEAVERHAEAASARLAEAADRLVERLDGLDAAPAGAPAEAIEALGDRLAGTEEGLGAIRCVMERVSHALDDLPNVRKERDGLLMYAANMRFILDNLDSQTQRLAAILDRTEGGIEAPAPPDPTAALDGVAARLEALEARVGVALEAREAAGDPVRAALAELLAAERRRRVAEVPRDEGA